jgi:hypothetical protein
MKNILRVKKETEAIRFWHILIDKRDYTPLYLRVLVIAVD